MGKATIIEAQNSDTIYEGGNNKGILGKLKGVFADYKHGTRNSDRLYSEELWDNRVFGSEDVMEALETKTLFGELDHPEGDRCETLAKNAAISITKLEKRPEEGVIYGEAEILDTPTGRIVKALADSGAKLGISSRGMGEEVFVDGQNIIDPDTYDFITFDVVVTPANTKARVELTESKRFGKLIENLKKEINDAETENQLNQIRSAINNINVYNKNELIDLVEARLTSFNTEIPNKLTEANKTIALKLLKQKYEESKAQLDEALQQSNSLVDENAKLLDENKFLKASRDKMRVRLGKTSDTVLRLKELKATENDTAKLEEGKLHTELAEMTNKLTEANKTIASLQDSLKIESRKNKERLLMSKRLTNKKIELINADNENKIREIQESLDNKQIKIDKLIESNKLKQDKINNYIGVLAENKKLKTKVLELENAQKEHQTKLTENKLQETKKIRSLEARIKELESNAKKMEEAQSRFSKLAFDPVGTVKAVAENFVNSDIDEDDIDLFNALTNRK